MIHFSRNSFPLVTITRTNSETQILNEILGTLKKLNSHVLDLALVSGLQLG